MRIPRFSLVLLAIAASACRPDAAPLAPVDRAPEPATRSVSLSCTVDVRRGTMTCEPTAPAGSGETRTLIVGGQNQYVKLTSSGTAYDSATERLTSDVTVKNLVPQTMGTSDGVTPDPAGVRVFFHAGPTVTGGTGTVSVLADSTDAFTAAAQPYYQYAGALLGPDGMLSQNETSSPRTWTFAVPATVATFTFQVLVWATVPLPDGWIELSPASDSVAVGDRVLFNPTIYTPGGIVREREVPWWSTSDAAVATVDSATGQVTGVAAGTATVTAHYGNAVGTATVTVFVGAGRQFTSVSTYDHSCALSPGGAAFCWGNDSDGQLGIGVVDTAKAPNAVPRAVTGGHVFRQVVTFNTASCGLDTNHEAWCWGSNYIGQLGVTTASETCTLHNTLSYPCSSTPLALSDWLKFRTLASDGGNYMCGIALDGDTYCWGTNEYGQLGDSTSTPSQEPIWAHRVSGGHKFTTVATGSQHACGLDADGTAWCWGQYSSALGVAGPGACPNNAPCNPTPTPVVGGLHFKSISLGSASTCAVTTDGVAYCWGKNFWGQNGTGGTSPDPVSTPTAVSTAVRFTAIDVGLAHTCALSEGGQAYCWGLNTYGQLGDGSTTDRYVPTLVAGGHTFTRVSTGTLTTCGVATDAHAYCWGFGGWAQIGDGNLNWENPTPVQVAAHP